MGLFYLPPGDTDSLVREIADNKMALWTWLRAFSDLSEKDKARLGLAVDKAYKWRDMGSPDFMYEAIDAISMDSIGVFIHFMNEYTNNDLENIANEMAIIPRVVADKKNSADEGEPVEGVLKNFSDWSVEYTINFIRSNAWARERIAKQTNSLEVLNAIEKMDSNGNVLAAVVKNGAFPAWRVGRYLTGPKPMPMVRRAIAERENLPTEIAEELMGPWPEIKTIVVRNHLRVLSEKTVDMLVTDPEEEVRVALAANDYTSADILERLAKDSSAHVLAAVASNLNASDDILRELVNNPTALVFTAVAKRVAGTPLLAELAVARPELAATYIAHKSASGEELSVEDMALGLRSPFRATRVATIKQAGKGIKR